MLNLRELDFARIDVSPLVRLDASLLYQIRQLRPSLWLDKDRGVVTDGAVAFDGHSWLGAPSAGLSLTPAAAFCWIKAAAGVNTSYRGIMVVNQRWSIYVVDGYLASYDWAGGTSNNSTSNVCDGQWHIVGLTWTDEGQADLWVDGESVLTFTKAANVNSPSSFTLGGSGAGGQEFIGTIDSALLADYPLSGAEVAELYNAGAGLTYSDLPESLKTNLVSWWDLDELSGTRYDRHGTNHLTETFSNVLTNSDFETLGAGGSDVFAGWIEVSTGTGVVAADDVNVDTGSHALKLTSGGDGDPAYVYQPSVFVVGNAYNYAVRVKKLSGSGAFLIGDTAGGAISHSASSEWETYTGTVVAYGSASMVYSPASANEIVVDSVSFYATKIPATTGIASGAATVGDAVALMLSRVGENQASQAVFAKRPRYDANGITFDVIDDLLNLQASINAAEVWTVQRDTPTGTATVVRNTTPATISAVAPAGKTVSDYLIFENALTTEQATQLETNLKKLRGIE